GLYHIHDQEFIHRDLHSGNILYSNPYSKHLVVISDLGISKSSTESTDNENNYGIIPFMAPEIFLGQIYTTKTDIYSFGMIMWELMTGRKPFWDQDQDNHLIIKIVDGYRPPIVTNAPEGFTELMQKCWHINPNERPTANYLKEKVSLMAAITYHQSIDAIYFLFIKPNSGEAKLFIAKFLNIEDNIEKQISKIKKILRGKYVNMTLNLQRICPSLSQEFYYYEKPQLIVI
ncbi:6468_t:CDS:2, partial [Funneliformis geosporum]